MNLFNMNNIIIFFFNHHFFFTTHRRVQMTRSGWTVLLAWSSAFTKACLSAELICMIFLLTAWELTERDNVSRRAEIRNDNLSFFPYIIIITALILFVFTAANLEVQHCKKNSAYPLKSSGHSLVQSSHVDTAHSCSRWSCRCTGRCGWRTSAATSPCHRGLSKGTGVRGGGCLRQCLRTDLSLCWHRTRHPPLRSGTGSTGHSAAPGVWHTPGETGPKSGWHIAPSPGGPLSTCLMERTGGSGLETQWEQSEFACRDLFESLSFLL